MDDKGFNKNPKQALGREFTTTHILKNIMRTVYSLFLLALFLPAGMAAHLLQDDVNAIVAKTKTLYKDTRTAKLTFSQSGSAGTASGTLEYSSGNKFRLTLPDRTIISDGNKTWTYLKERNQVVINKAASNGQVTPNDILRSFPGDYQSVLDGSATAGGNAVWVVQCSASGSNRVGDISNATLYIDKKTYRFRKISVTSPSLGTMTLDISKAQYNLSLPSSRFTFTPPKDAKVIDLTK